MKIELISVIILLIVLLLFDLGLPHNDSLVGQYIYYGIAGSFFFAIFSVIVSTLIKNKQGDQ